MNQIEEQNQLIVELLEKTKGKLIKSVYKPETKDPEDLEQELKLKLIEIIREDRIKKINFEEFIKMQK